jgi:plasmid stabilization system protein ParE
MAERIRWSDMALRDFKATLDFYNNRNKSKIFSKKLVHEVNNVLKTLLKYPELGKPTEDSELQVLIKGN